MGEEFTKFFELLNCCGSPHFFNSTSDSSNSWQKLAYDWLSLGSLISEIFMCKFKKKRMRSIITFCRMLSTGKR